MEAMLHNCLPAVSTASRVLFAVQRQRPRGYRVRGLRKRIKCVRVCVCVCLSPTYAHTPTLMLERLHVAFLAPFCFREMHSLLLQSAWMIVNDTLHTDACLLFSPDLIALGAYTPKEGQRKQGGLWRDSVCVCVCVCVRERERGIHNRRRQTDG